MTSKTYFVTLGFSKPHIILYIIFLLLYGKMNPLSLSRQNLDMYSPASVRTGDHGGCKINHPGHLDPSSLAIRQLVGTNQYS